MCKKENEQKQCSGDCKCKSEEKAQEDYAETLANFMLGDFSKGVKWIKKLHGHKAEFKTKLPPLSFRKINIDPSIKELIKENRSLREELNKTSCTGFIIRLQEALKINNLQDLKKDIKSMVEALVFHQDRQTSMFKSDEEIKRKNSKERQEEFARQYLGQPWENCGECRIVNKREIKTCPFRGTQDPCPNQLMDEDFIKENTTASEIRERYFQDLMKHEELALKHLLNPDQKEFSGLSVKYPYTEDILKDENDRLNKINTANLKTIKRLKSHRDRLEKECIKHSTGAFSRMPEPETISIYKGPNAKPDLNKPSASDRECTTDSETIIELFSELEKRIETTDKNLSAITSETSNDVQKLKSNTVRSIHTIKQDIELNKKISHGEIKGLKEKLETLEKSNSICIGCPSQDICGGLDDCPHGDAYKKQDVITASEIIENKEPEITTNTSCSQCGYLIPLKDGFYKDLENLIYCVKCWKDNEIKASELSDEIELISTDKGLKELEEDLKREDIVEPLPEDVLKDIVKDLPEEGEDCPQGNI